MFTVWCRNDKNEVQVEAAQFVIVFIKVIHKKTEQKVFYVCILYTGKWQGIVKLAVFQEDFFMTLISPQAFILRVCMHKCMVTLSFDFIPKLM